MPFICVEFICRPCEGRGVPTLLGAWAVETRDEMFDPSQAFAKGENQHETLQELPTGASGLRQHYVMVCPRCRHRVEMRAENVDKALSALYVTGAPATTHRIPL
jgi:hypothetical protein